MSRVTHLPNPEMSIVRRSRLLLVPVLAVLFPLLAGCASETPGVSSGGVVESVTVSGDFGKAPTVTFSAPLVAQEPQCIVTIPGSGAQVQSTDITRIGYQLFDATTGKLIASGGYDTSSPTLYPLGLSSSVAALDQILECGRVGSRVVAAIPAPAAAQMIQSNSAALVGVFDILNRYPSRATGVPQIAQDGFPAVVLAPNGQPGILVPAAKQPTAGEAELLRRGQGDTVRTNTVVLVQILQVDWATNTVTQSTWTRSPVEIDPSNPGAVPPTVVSAIVGRTVGSQIGVIVPGGTPGSGTQFYVIDVLGIV